MGAPTDTALQLARDIEAEVAADPHADDGDRRGAARQILGAWRLAMRLDYPAADEATDEFTAIERRVLAGGRGGLAQVIAPTVTL
jgi:hypothetical protein